MRANGPFTMVLRNRTGQLPQTGLPATPAPAPAPAPALAIVGNNPFSVLRVDGSDPTDDVQQQDGPDMNSTHLTLPVSNQANRVASLTAATDTASSSLTSLDVADARSELEVPLPDERAPPMSVEPRAECSRVPSMAQTADGEYLHSVADISSLPAEIDSNVTHLTPARPVPSSPRFTSPLSPLPDIDGSVSFASMVNAALVARGSPPLDFAISRLSASLASWDPYPERPYLFKIDCGTGYDDGAASDPSLTTDDELPPLVSVAGSDDGNDDTDEDMPPLLTASSSEDEDDDMPSLLSMSDSGSEGEPDDTHDGDAEDNDLPTIDPVEGDSGIRAIPYADEPVIESPPSDADITAEFLTDDAPVVTNYDHLQPNPSDDEQWRQTKAALRRVLLDEDSEAKSWLPSPANDSAPATPSISVASLHLSPPDDDLATRPPAMAARPAYPPRSWLSLYEETATPEPVRKRESTAPTHDNSHPYSSSFPRGGGGCIHFPIRNFCSGGRNSAWTAARR